MYVLLRRAIITPSPIFLQQGPRGEHGVDGSTWSKMAGRSTAQEQEWSQNLFKPQNTHWNPLFGDIQSFFCCFSHGSTIIKYDDAIQWCLKKSLNLSSSTFEVNKWPTCSVFLIPLHWAEDNNTCLVYLQGCYTDHMKPLLDIHVEVML